MIFDICIIFICIILCGTLCLYFNFHVIIFVGFVQDMRKRTKFGALDGGL